MEELKTMRWMTWIMLGILVTTAACVNQPAEEETLSLETLRETNTDYIEEEQVSGTVNVNVEPKEDDIKGIIVNGVTGSGSMLPLVTPETKVLKVRFNDTEPKCGHFYSYSKPNSTRNTIHIYVYEGEEGYYFKGINNRYWDDPIQVEQIEYEIFGVKLIEIPYDDGLEGLK